MERILSVLVTVGFWFSCGDAWTCPSNSPKMFVTEIQHAELHFQVFVTSELRTFKIWSPTDISLLSVAYRNFIPLILVVNNTYCTFTGSAEAGQLYLSLKESSSPGVYRLENAGVSVSEQCIIVYLLGVPAIPLVFQDRIPSVGESVTLTCSSLSTTTPSNHSLAMVYNWMVDNVNNPEDSRYKYSNSRSSVTLTDIVKEDAGKQFSCTATKDVINGYTSGRSTTIAINVYHGPFVVEINIPNVYRATEDDVLPDISCICDCFPACSYSWTYENHIISNNSTLSLGSAKRKDAGNYTCTCTRAKSLDSKQANFTFIVNYAPDVTVRVSPTTVKRGEPFTIFCDATGVPPTYNFTGFKQTMDEKVIDRIHHSVYGTPAKSNVYVTAAQVQDTGTYTCQVSNGIRKHGTLEQTASIEIKVQGVPVFLSRQNKFFGIVGQTLHVIVTFYSHPVFTEIVVLRSDRIKLTNSAEGGRNITNTSIATMFYSTAVTVQGTELLLSFYNLSNEDLTSYTILVTNSIGTESFCVIVDEIGPPLPPTNFKASVLSAALLFTWNSNSDESEAHYFLIQTFAEHDRSGWKNQTLVNATDDNMLDDEGHYVAGVSVDDGVYLCRIIALNAFGTSDAVNYSEKLTVRKEIADMYLQNNKDSSAVIIGPVLGILVVGLMVMVVLQARRIRRLLNSDVCSKKAKTASHKEGVPYANTAYTAEGEASTDRGQYSSLDDHQRRDIKTYDIIVPENSGQAEG